MAIELMTYSEFGEELDLTQQLIAEMLGEIGIETELTRNEGTILWADYASGGLEQNGKFDLNLWDDGYQGVDPTDFLWFYYHSEASQPDNGWNIVRWKNPEMDALIDQAYTLDDDLRKELFCQMADLMEAELPNIPLFSIINADAYAVRLQGIKSNVNDVVTWNVADWTLAR
jgi:ABC-type transport system substrate-binding protein